MTLEAHWTGASGPVNIVKTLGIDASTPEELEEIFLTDYRQAFRANPPA